MSNINKDRQSLEQMLLFSSLLGNWGFNQFSTMITGTGHVPFPQYDINDLCFSHTSLTLYLLDKQKSPRWGAAERGITPGAIMFA